MTRLLLLLVLCLPGLFPVPAHAASPSGKAPAANVADSATNAPPVYTGPFPRPLDTYQDDGSVDAGTVLISRAFAEPFNIVATAIFLLAIIHTFLAPKIFGLSHRLQRAYEGRLREKHGTDFDENVPQRQRQSIPAAILHFFGEV